MALVEPNIEGQRLGEFVWIERFPHPLRRPFAAMTWLARVLIGIVTILVLLTITAAVPVANLFVLGYLLEVEGQVARSGKLQHALPLLPAAMRIGSLVVGMWLCFIPVFLLADIAADARMIAPHAVATRLWIAAVFAASPLAAAHVLMASLRGGTLGCFLRPIKNVLWLRDHLHAGDFWSSKSRGLKGFLGALRPLHHFWLGIRGFLGTWLWLALPNALHGFWWYSDSTSYRLLTLLGGACFVPVMAWVPFLQIRLAVEDRWSAMFDVHAIRELFRHSPLSWLAATAALYSLSIPLFLYTLHFRMRAPFDLGVWWDLSFISIACTLPARAALGWAYHRATKHEIAWKGWIWMCRLLLTSALVLYTWLLFQTPLTHDARPWQLEHHALVLPIPW